MSWAVDEVFCEGGERCISSLKDSKLPKLARLVFPCALCALILGAFSCFLHAIIGCATRKSNKNWAVEALFCCMRLVGGERAKQFVRVPSHNHQSRCCAVILVYMQSRCNSSCSIA
jgi:hypothetical protein